jgi:protein PhnA
MGRRIRQRAAVGVLGKFVTRRSHGRCELCGGRDGLRLWEIPPFPEEPDPESTLLACARCRAWLEEGDIEPLEARFLSGAVWSDLAAVREAARRLLSAAPSDDPWIRDALEVLG